MIRTRHTRADTAVVDGSTLTVCLVPWDTPATVTDNGRDYYDESFAPDGLEVPDRLLGELEHDGALIGRAKAVDSRPDGLYADVQISQSTAGRDFLADYEAGIYEAVSIDFDDDPTPVPAGGNIRRSGARLTRFAFTTDPQHAGARVVGRRSNPEGAPPIMDTDTITDPVIDEEADDATDTEQLDHQRSKPAPARQAPKLGELGHSARSSARFRSFGEFLHASIHGEIDTDERARYTRALDTTVTTEQTGLVKVGWIESVIDLVRTYTPTVEAFETMTLEDGIGSVSQPKVSVRPTVATQSQNAEIESTAVEITKVDWSISTYAGGQNIPLQVIRRSSPSYLEAVVRLHIQEMAKEVNSAVVAAVEAAVPGSGTPGTGHVVDATADFRDDLVDASALILADLKRFPEFVLLPTAMWVSLAKTDGGDGRPLYAAISPTNTAGTVAISLNGQALNLPFIVEPELTSTTAVVATADAFRTFRSPVQTLAADVVSTLGRDVAVWQEVAMGAVDANGLAAIDGA